jgi:hypothetical protein
VELRLPQARGSGRGTLEILTVTGRRVWAAPLVQGQTFVRWNGRDVSGHEVPTGVYLSRLTFGSSLAARGTLICRR